jgi:hypothetical protein
MLHSCVTKALVPRQSQFGGSSDTQVRVRHAFIWNGSTLLSWESLHYGRGCSCFYSHCKVVHAKQGNELSIWQAHQLLLSVSVLIDRVDRKWRP